MSGRTFLRPPNVTYSEQAPLSFEARSSDTQGDPMKKVRLLLTALFTTLALTAAACSSPTGLDDHTLGSGNHTLGSGNHTLGSGN